MTNEEISVFKPLMRIATEAYTNIALLNTHYIETISKLTGKQKSEIEEELQNLLPEQKKKTEKFILEITELYKPKVDVL